MEEVTVKKFKSLNGYVYDTEKDALAADAMWTKENTVNLEKEIRLLVNHGSRYIEREKKEHEKNPSSYNTLLVEKTKHGDCYYLTTNPEVIGKICISIIKNNIDWGFYHSIRDEAVTNEIVKTNNTSAAIAFIKERRNYEYEEVEITSASVYS